MKEISAVDLAVVSGSCDMIPMASNAEERVTAAARAMGLLPK
jgi:hypothetical protein